MNPREVGTQTRHWKSVAIAAEVMREVVKKQSTRYLVQSALMILTGAQLRCSFHRVIDGSRILRRLAPDH
jgi:hypothetical protein